MTANAALAQAFAAPMEEPAPPALRRMILGGADAAPNGRRCAFPSPSRRRTAALWGGLGAAVALAAGVAIAVFLPAAGALTLAPGPLAANSPVGEALEHCQPVRCNALLTEPN